MNTDAYEEMTWETPSDELADAVEDLLAEVKRLRDLVDFAIAVIDSNHCYMGEEAQADLLKHLRLSRDSERTEWGEEE
jgi:hypothetical protein